MKMPTNKTIVSCLGAAICLFSIPAIAAEKHHEDPTKIVSKVGLGYNDNFVISGSLGLGPVKKINARINDDASEWRLGGSWLFKLGIVNFNFSQTDLGDGANKRNYSIGTFVPLNTFDIAPAGWQIFPMAGINYNEGDALVQSSDPTFEGEYVLTPATTNGGYIGAFTFKPLGGHWALLAYAGASRGSDDYAGSWGGIGTSYTIDEKQSFNIFASTSDDDFGQQQRASISYTREFK